MLYHAIELPTPWEQGDGEEGYTSASSWCPYSIKLTSPMKDCSGSRYTTLSLVIMNESCAMHRSIYIIANQGLGGSRHDNFTCINNFFHSVMRGWHIMTMRHSYYTYKWGRVEGGSLCSSSAAPNFGYLPSHTVYLHACHEVLLGRPCKHE